jgi:hypothetical protein
MTTDDESKFDDNDAGLSEERQRAVDELGHRAGAALRRPPPEHGLADIARHARNQRLMRGGVVVVGIAVLIIGGVAVIGGGDDEQNRVIITNTVPSATQTAPENDPTTAPVPTTEGATTTAPVTAPTKEPTPTTERWVVESPGSIDMQPHAGSPPAMMLVTDDGSTVTVRNPWQWDVTTRIRPTDENGTTLVINSLRSTAFFTIAISTDGRVVQIDPWHASSTLWQHPGEVTDASPVNPLTSGSNSPLGFWSVGFDQVDGQRTPVVWYNTGPVADDQGTVTGVPTATVVATGEPGGTARPLITGDASVAYVLLPEPDGRSRLWIVQQDNPGSQGTDLTFREPTAMVIGGDGALWVADRDGLHVVDVETPTLAVRNVSDTPIRSLLANYNDPGHAVLILDDNGVVASVAGSGGTVEHYRDDAATAMLAHPFGPDGRPQLFLVHGGADEVIIVDLDVFPNSGGGWSWN